MTTNPRRYAAPYPLIALAAALLAAGATAPAQAQVKPFKITGGGAGPIGLPLPGQPPRPHWAIGTATHLGRYFGLGTVATDSAEFNPVTGKIEGEFGSGSPFVFVGADCDKLVCNYGRTAFGAKVPGTVELTILGVTPGGDLIVEAFWVAEFVPDPQLSTGKFAGIKGSWIMYARSCPFVLGSDDPAYYTWEGEGKLEFAKRRK
jgi:hypothetical protein